jgi:hypothetical protein
MKMRPRFLTGLLLMVSAITAIAASEENINETHDVKPGGKLIVDVDFGTIEVSAGDNDKVVVNAYRRIEASSKEKEKEYVDRVPIKITTEGNSVIVRARREKESNGWKFWNWDGNTNTDARYTIRVPATFNADLQTAGGAISASDLTGTIRADTSGGDLKFSRLRGPIDAESSGGDIEIAGCEGAIDTETSGGKIKSVGGSGSLNVRTAGGAIAVDDFGGDASVETSGGKLALENIRGKLRGETSGGSISVVLPSPVSGDVKLETSAGAIQVMAPANCALTVDAETSAGNVTSELPITAIRAGPDGLKGTINGGGKSLILRSGAGGIAIKSATPPPSHTP